MDKSPKKIGWIKAFVALSSAAIPVYCYVQNNLLEANEIHLESSRVPKGFDGFKLSHVSDLHNKEFGKNHRKIIAKINEFAPDAIAITGDLIDRRITKLSVAMDFIKRAVKIAPIYYVTGNHEKRSENYSILKRELLSAGVNIMDNRYVMLHRNGDVIQLMGLGDFAVSEPFSSDMYGEMVSKIIAPMKREHKLDFTVLLAHRPEYFYAYATENIDVTLTGHSHGGQIRLPGIGGLYAPGQGFLPKYCGGVYHKEKSVLISSRGLGNTSRFPMRINNHPEILGITFHRK